MTAIDLEARYCEAGVGNLTVGVELRHGVADAGLHAARRVLVVLHQAVIASRRLRRYLAELARRVAANLGVFTSSN